MKYALSNGELPDAGYGIEDMDGQLFPVNKAQELREERLITKLDEMRKNLNDKHKIELFTDEDNEK